MKPTPRDTTLDALAAQVRRRPPLAAEEVSALLTDAADGGREAARRLVEHHLVIALDSALARGERGVEVADLYQEGSFALVDAVAVYAAAHGPAGELGEHLRVAVDRHLDAVVAGSAAMRAEDEAFVRDARALDMVEVGLRGRLGRPPTTSELAGTLRWTESRVELIASLVADARALHDESLIPYLDDD